MRKLPIKIPIAQWFVAIVFVVLSLALLYWFVTYREPAERRPGIVFEKNYSDDPLISALTPANLQQSLQQIQQAGEIANSRQIGRFTGSPGFYNTEKLIESAFQKAGMRVVTQEFPVVVPVTEYCDILDENGKPLPGITLYPFEPSGLLPQTVLDKGLSGKLVQTYSSNPLDLYGKKLEGSIVLNVGTGSNAFNCSWPSLAAVGVKAVIIQDPTSANSVSDTTGNWASMKTPLEAQYPRFLVRGPLAKYLDRSLTIRCKVTWQTKRVRNILGVLPGDGSAREALILNSYYDSSSLVPEVSPGAEQALSLATLLNLARALQPYRGHFHRDIIFIATAAHCQTQEGAMRILSTIENLSSAKEGPASFGMQLQAQQTMLRYIQQARGILNNQRIWSQQHPSLFAREWKNDATYPPAFRRWFEKCFSTIAGEADLVEKDDTLAARLEWIRHGRPVFKAGFNTLTATKQDRENPANRDEYMNAYMAAKLRETMAANTVTMQFWAIPSYLQTRFTERGYMERARQYFERLATYHQDKLKELSDSIALRTLLLKYNNTLMLNLELYSGGHGTPAAKDLMVLAGFSNPGTSVEPQSTDLRIALSDQTPLKGTDPVFQVFSWGTRDAQGAIDAGLSNIPVNNNIDSALWFKCSRSAFTLLNKTYYPAKLGTPEDTFDALSTQVLSEQLVPIGKMILEIAHGKITFKNNVSIPNSDPLVSLFGHVYTTSGTSSTVPSHPMTERTFIHGYVAGRPAGSSRGIRYNPTFEVDPYGRYERHLNVNFDQYGTITVDAARFAADGSLLYFKDAGPNSQTIFKNEALLGTSLALGTAKEINLSLFRCALVSCYQRGNPKSFSAFQRLDFIENETLEPLAIQRVINPSATSVGSIFDLSSIPAITAFLEPDAIFAIGLMDGSAQNKDILTYRAFMFNVDPDENVNKHVEELYGRGYLAADTANLTFPYIDAAASMLRTNEKRLALQNRYHMADKQMLESQRQGEVLLQEARKKRAEGDALGAMTYSAMSLATAINNHPVIRTKISNAVFGILWYLMLLVPFVFFFEKLLFGFTDVRKQLLANGIIFICVFALLQYFHPAFRMVRSPLMILLGFLIFMLSLAVSFMVSGKFKQNLTNLRKREGHVEGADINRSGVIGTAFMLGVNNMRRRKVRTGLTCVALVLITFVMICFTSVSTDLQNVEYSTGRAPANGIMRRDPNFVSIDQNELDNLTQTYGLEYPIATHSWLVGSIALLNNLKNPEITIDYSNLIGGVSNTKSAKVNGAMTMPWNEPDFSGIDKYLLKPNRGWFPRPPDTPSEIAAGKTNVNYVMLPDVVATALNLTPEDVYQNHRTVSIKGETFEVLGIFDAKAMTQHVGMDGQSILPYDLNSVQTLGRPSSGAGYIVPMNIGRLPGSNVIIVNKTFATVLATESQITVSCMVLFPSKPYKLRADLPPLPAVSYKKQRDLVSNYLERVGIPAYYAIDGISYYGSRTRAKTTSGLLELLIPILIAAMMVFNTMRSSVYERREEIYVYNAVGIAPNHVFFMFMAEASVYAVMGAMLGYLLSQVTGTVLTWFGVTSGLNMDYSSIETIYASLAIVAAVLISTLIPAREAARLASPAEDSHLTMPKVENDTMTFNLPFTFTAHDRVAVISYFYRWLDANGEGSSGMFYCTKPEPLVTEGIVPDGTEIIPGISSIVWLKPYDMGVSQRLTINLPTDPETGEFIARITIERLSGTMTAWNRTVQPFLTALRKQFLSWRAVTDVERGEMFDEAKNLLTQIGNVERTANG